MKIISFIIHIVLQAAPAAIGLPFLILAFDGYTNSSDAEPGFIIYIILALLDVFGLGIVCAFVAQWLAGRLEKKTAQANFWGPAISITIFAFVGWAMLVV